MFVFIQKNSTGLNLFLWHMVIALGNRFWLFIQTLNNDKKTIQFNIQFIKKIKLFIQKIYSFKNNSELFIQRIYSFKKKSKIIHSKNLFIQKKSKIIHSKKIFIQMKNGLSRRAIAIASPSFATFFSNFLGVPDSSVAFV